jgi:hypothetical protein
MAKAESLAANVVLFYEPRRTPLSKQDSQKLSPVSGGGEFLRVLLPICHLWMVAYSRAAEPLRRWCAWTSGWRPQTW